MKELIKKVSSYSKVERIKRVIEISVKGENVNPFEMIELSIIEAIRESNGECDEVRKSRENDLESK